MSEILTFRPRYVRSLGDARFVHPANTPVIIVEQDPFPWRNIAKLVAVCGGTVLVAVVVMFV